MRITVVSTMAGTPWTGSEELWFAMTQEALAAGHQVSASVFRWPVVPEKIRQLEAAGVRMLWRRRSGLPDLDELVGKIAAKLSKQGTFKPFQFPMIGQLGAQKAFVEIERTRPDVLCVNQGSPYDLFDAPDSKVLMRRIADGRIPYVLVCQQNNENNVPDAFFREELTRLYTGARRLAFVSQRNLLAAERQLAIRLPNAAVFTNPVNLADLTPVPSPATISGRVRMACVARLDAFQKGHDILFETLSASVWQKRNWELNLFGTGPDENYLRALARHYQVADRVTFCGQASDVRAIWADHHLCILPSRSEGAPLALVEAMVCGRAAVVTDVGGNNEWVEEGHSGFVAAAATARSFDTALDRAWQNQDDWPELGLRAHARATAKLARTPPGKILLQALLDAAVVP